MTERSTELIEHLKGTCLSLNEGCQTFGFDEDNLTLEEVGKLDNELFRCDECSWWCEIDESHETGIGNVCNDCWRDGDTI